MSDLDLRVLKPICISRVQKTQFRTKEIYYSLLSLKLIYSVLFAYALEPSIDYWSNATVKAKNL